MPANPWFWLLTAWLVVAGLRLAWFGWRAGYLLLIRHALNDYHRAVPDRRRSRWEGWLRRQRRAVQTILFESGQYDHGPSPSEGGRATKLNIYALESLEHWLSEHPQGMARARESMDRAIGIYLRRAASSLNPFFWIDWLLFFPRKLADRIGVAGDPEWTASLQLLYWTGLAAALVTFLIFFIRH